MNRGGMEKFIMNIYRKIDRKKYQFHFAVHTNEESDFDKEIKSLGGEIIVFPKFRQNPIKYRNVWNKFWKKNNEFYSAFHFHTNTLGNIEGIKAALNNKFRKIIIHAHSSYATKGKFQKLHLYFHRLNQKYVLRNELICLAVSNKAAKWVFGHDSLVSGKVKIINNGIDYEEFYFNKASRFKTRNKLNIDNALVLGHVGNFLPVKNHEFLIKVFEELLKLHKNSRLILLGDGPLQEQIKQNINNSEIQNKVFFIGNIPDVSEYLNSMDVFMFPSLYEGLGLSMIEAQINGLPVIYSDTITNEVEISEYCSNESLESSPSVWALKLYQYSSYRNTTKFLDPKFDINNTVIKITKIYSDLS